MTYVHRYCTGEEVLAGDIVDYAGEKGTVEFVAVDGTPEYEWYVQQFPPHGGAMIRVQPFGSLFSNPANDEDLTFVARGRSREVL